MEPWPSHCTIAPAPGHLPREALPGAVLSAMAEAGNVHAQQWINAARAAALHLDDEGIQSTLHILSSALDNVRQLTALDALVYSHTAGGFLAPMPEQAAVVDAKLHLEHQQWILHGQLQLLVASGHHRSHLPDDAWRYHQLRQQQPIEPMRVPLPTQQDGQRGQRDRQQGKAATPSEGPLEVHSAQGVPAENSVRRQRQIEIGKSRPEYQKYVEAVPVSQRSAHHPRTPDPKEKISRRAFDKKLSEWRRKLHDFDTFVPGQVAFSAASADPSPSDTLPDPWRYAFGISPETLQLHARRP